MASPTKILSGVHLSYRCVMSAGQQVTRPEAGEHDSSGPAEGIGTSESPLLQRFFGRAAYPALRGLKALHYSLLLLSVVLTIESGPAPGLILLAGTLLLYFLAANSISTAYMRSQDQRASETK